jgi:hypothetical protein
MRVARSLIAILILLGSIVASATVPTIAAPIEPRRLQVDPPSINLNGPNAHQQLVVTLFEPDGSARDVTRLATYQTDQSLVRVNKSGFVTVQADGSSHLKISFQEHSVDPTVSSQGSKTSRFISYRHEIAPLLSKSGCNMGACHGNINGKGGFRLTLRGENPGVDFLSITHDAFARRLDRSNAAASLIVLKPTGQLPHEGGVRFDINSFEAKLIQSWAAEGAKDDILTASKVVRIRVSPEERRIVAPALTQQLVIMAEYADGSIRDVTQLAAFDVDDPTKVIVDPHGLVTTKTPGEATVAVRYQNARAVSRLAFLHDHPNFVAGLVPTDNFIDQHVFAKLNRLKINPSEPSTDAVFLRRAYLDAIGLPPSPTEARAFLNSTDPAKRAKLVDQLVSRPEFADFWALKWADLLRNEEKVMGDKGVWIFQRWLRDQVAADVPLDQFARELVSAQGSTYRNPPASFYRTNNDPQTAAETVGQVFLGVRLQCARCHNHPYDNWTQNDYYGLSAYFANVNRRILDDSKRDKFDKHEINGDVIIHLTGRPKMVQPRSGEMMQPKPPGGPERDPQGDPNALNDLAQWLTHKNPQFDRSMANRIWFHLLGRGIVEPVDDFRDSNPPSNPELLDALTAEFQRNGMRIRPLAALIMKSRTYALGSESNDSNRDDLANFSHALIKLNSAEVLLDSIGFALEKPERFPRAPETARATQLPGIQSGGSFLKTFGKPERLLICECERSDSTTLAQAFQLINGTSIRDKIESDNNRIGRLISEGKTDDKIGEELALAILNRPLSTSEKVELLPHVQKAKDRRKAWEDVAWVLLNTKEFLLRH